MRRLNSYIGGANNELTLVAIKLMHAISEFAGGREKKSLFDAFLWEMKVSQFFTSENPCSSKFS
jgi:nucleolar pre-ribosomal-associated protein 1